MSRRYDAKQFAQVLGYPNIEAFNNARAQRLIPIPDGIFDRFPYWREETVKETLHAEVSAIRAAFGYKPAAESGGDACPDR